MTRQPKFNEVRWDGDTAQVVLTNRRGEEVAVALLDRDGYERVKDRRLYLHEECGRRLVATRVAGKRGRPFVPVWQLLVDDPTIDRIRYLNGNPLDLRASNLPIRCSENPFRYEGDQAFLTVYGDSTNPTRAIDVRLDRADADRVRVMGLYWHLRADGYIYARRRMRNGQRTTYLLHRVVLGSPPGLYVDHRRHDTCDCRQRNLRPATASQNGQNRRGAQSNSSTGIRGVWVDRTKRRYIAGCKVGGKTTRRYFPMTEGGLALAAEAALALRLRLMEFSDGR
jgi:hypothetical protein